jgi:hypothetical protein
MPTQSFPYPVANMLHSNTDFIVTNLLSYMLIDTFTCQGLGDLINKLCSQKIGLKPISMDWILELSAKYCPTHIGLLGLTPKFLGSSPRITRAQKPQPE